MSSRVVRPRVFADRSGRLPDPTPGRQAPNPAHRPWPKVRSTPPTVPVPPPARQSPSCSCCKRGSPGRPAQGPQVLEGDHASDFPASWQGPSGCRRLRLGGHVGMADHLGAAEGIRHAPIQPAYGSFDRASRRTHDGRPCAERRRRPVPARPLRPRARCRGTPLAPVPMNRCGTSRSMAAAAPVTPGCIRDRSPGGRKTA
jgi:hypothetical protein